MCVGHLLTAFFFTKKSKKKLKIYIFKNIKEVKFKRIYILSWKVISGKQKLLYKNVFKIMRNKKREKCFQTFD